MKYEYFISISGVEGKRMCLLNFFRWWSSQAVHLDARHFTADDELAGASSCIDNCGSCLVQLITTIQGIRIRPHELTVSVAHCWTQKFHYRVGMRVDDIAMAGWIIHRSPNPCISMPLSSLLPRVRARWTRKWEITDVLISHTIWLIRWNWCGWYIYVLETKT